MIHDTSDTNPWSNLLGPFYSAEGLVGRGLEVSDDLIGLTTANGVTIYPHAQFEVSPNGLQRREPVLKLWNELIQPAIEKGIVDEWTATGQLLQGNEDHPCKADIITEDPSQVARVAREIARSLARFAR